MAQPAGAIAATAADPASSPTSGLLSFAVVGPFVLGLFPVMYALKTLGADPPLWVATCWQLTSTVTWLALASLLLPWFRRIGEQNEAAGKPALSVTNEAPRVAGAGILCLTIHAVVIATANTVLMLGRPRLAFLDVLGSAFAIYAPLDFIAIAGIFGIASLAAERRAHLREQSRATSLEHQLDDAQLRVLRMQLQPHFLFNALGAAATLARRGEGDAAAGVLVDLGELLRHVLDRSATPTVTVAEEVAFATRYLDIERVRFGDRLAVDLDVADGAARRSIPSLLLQPLVENAVKHGIAQRETAGGRIRISVRTAAGALVLVVEDNGPGLPSGFDLTRTGGMGLRATRERLATLGGSLAIESTTHGTHATLRIPVGDEAGDG